MVRRFGVLAGMLLVIAGLAWAGVVNLRARRATVEGTHVELIPAAAAAAGAGAPDAEGAGLQGKPAPSFTLVNTAGRKVSLSDFKGKAVIVNFWATWCGPCKLEMPWFEEFSRKYAPQGLVVLGLNQDDGMAPGEVSRVAKKIADAGRRRACLQGLRRGRLPAGDLLRKPGRQGRQRVRRRTQQGPDGSDDSDRAFVQVTTFGERRKVKVGTKTVAQAVVLLSASLGACLSRAQEIHLGDDVPGASASRRQHVELVSDVLQVKADRPEWVELRFRVDPGFHINSHTPHDELLVPTVLDLTGAEQVRTIQQEYPAGVPLRLEVGDGQTLSTYQGEFRVRLQLVVPTGDRTLLGSLKYQACDARSCFPPRSLPVKVAVAAR